MFKCFFFCKYGFRLSAEVKGRNHEGKINNNVKTDVTENKAVYKRSHTPIAPSQIKFSSYKHYVVY